MISFQYLYLRDPSSQHAISSNRPALNHPRPTFKDAPLSSINGFVGLGAHALLSLLLLFGQVLWAFAWPVAILLNVGGGILWFLMWNSYVIVNPNEAVVTQFFGKYVGTLKQEGFRFFINPLYGKSRISLRINNFESSKLKVNMSTPTPSTSPQWSFGVYDAAEAMFEVEKYQHYVQIQSEAALREMATKYPYDAIEEKDIGGITLSATRTSSPKNSRPRLRRAFPAGIAVLEARIATLPTPQRLLKPCFAVNRPAPWSLRAEIVDGAVGMVELALEQLSAKDIIELDEERRRRWSATSWLSSARNGHDARGQHGHLVSVMLCWRRPHG